MGCFPSKDNELSNKPGEIQPAAFQPLVAVEIRDDNSSGKKACFGAGCYWGTEKYFHSLGGDRVIGGAVGFMVNNLLHPYPFPHIHHTTHPLMYYLRHSRKNTGERW
jgi:hypothetical protein